MEMLFFITLFKTISLFSVCSAQGCEGFRWVSRLSPGRLAREEGQKQKKAEHTQTAPRTPRAEDFLPEMLWVVFVADPAGCRGGAGANLAWTSISSLCLVNR